VNIAELRARLEAIDVERRAIHTAAGEAALNEDQSTRWEALDTDEAEARTALAEAEVVESRAAKVAESRVKWGGVQVAPKGTDVLSIDGAGVSRQVRADTLIRALEGQIDDTDNQKHFEKVVKRHASDGAWAQNLLSRSRPDYVSAFAKMMTGRDAFLTSEERAAIQTGTATQGGGLLVPTFLDPTLILTNTGTANAIRPISRVVTLTTGNVWHGVTTAGVTASFDAELAEVSDDTPTFAGAAIPLHTARAFVQASYESFDDIDNLGSDVLMLFADARDRLEGLKHAVGAGTTEPLGVFTAVNASTGQQVIATTNGSIGLVDIQAVYNALGRRWRQVSTWVMAPKYLLAIQALGTALSASYTTNLGQSPTDVLLGRPLVDTDDAPITSGTNTADMEILLGDMKQFIIVDKPGSMSVEFVPQLFNTANNLPDGRRGWIAHWRNGSDAPNLKGFELLVDKTT
jgi:HK97 family phage major capsid protein